MRNLVEGLSWADGWASVWNVPTKAALFKARARLGFEPVEALYRAPQRGSACHQQDQRRALYRSVRLMSIDGTCLDVADTEANERSSAVRARVALTEPGRSPSCAWWAWPSQELMPSWMWRWAATTTPSSIWYPAGSGASLRAGHAVLADRGFFSFSLWEAARFTGAAPFVADEVQSCPARRASLL